MNIEHLFFELIRVAIGNQLCLSHTPSADEWGALYAIAKKQSLVGVCFAGVQRLKLSETLELSETLRLRWMGMAAKIQQRNEVVNRQCVEVQKKIEADGFRTYIMKGQGNAALYRVSSGFTSTRLSTGAGFQEVSGGSSSNESINHKPSEPPPIG